MASDLLLALENIASSTSNDLRNPFTRRTQNRANAMGYALEDYVKDCFCPNPEGITDENRDEKHSEVFAWKGNQNHPPDAIIRGGDAMEIKKFQTYARDLALNSSYPKSKLHSDGTRLVRACRDCEPSWQVKDIMYVVGTIKENKVRQLTFAYGDCFAASKEVYEKIEREVSSGLRGTELELSAETNELGHVNRVDPLGITYLRIRGMWGIRSPSFYFRDFIAQNDEDDMTVSAIMRKAKYETFSASSRRAAERAGYEISDKRIKNPDNPAQLIDAKIMVLRRSW